MHKSTKGVAVHVDERCWAMPAFHLLPESLFIPQNLPSIIAVRELDVQPGMTVLDMCASPGGKSSHIAALLQNSGLLLAIDRSATKVAKLASNLQKWGVTCARSVVFDSTQLCADVQGEGTAHSVDPQQFWGLKGQRLKPDCFDRILLDPPCSGIGQRPIFNADALSNCKGEYASYQLRLFRTAVQLLAPGGKLVYSTCTLSPKENEQVVTQALESLPINIVTPKFGGGSHGLASPAAQNFPVENVQRFWPAGGPCDSIGFFYAVFQKNK